MPNRLERYISQCLGNFDEPEDYPFSNLLDEDGWDSGNDILEPLNDSLFLDRERSPSAEEVQLIEGGLRQRGMDVLAFYKSRRYLNRRPYVGKWGIFYLSQGLQYIKEQIESTYAGFSPLNEQALEFLRAHERFHLKFDLYSLALESASGQALYTRLNMQFRKSPQDLVEEALANRDALIWAKKNHLEDFARGFMDLQPGSYSRFDEKPFGLKSELAGNLLGDFSATARRDDLAYWVAQVPNEYLGRPLCPEYMVRPCRSSWWISPSLRLVVKDIHESSEFLKKLNTMVEVT